MFLLAFTALIMWLTLLTGIPDKEDSADFHVLLLGGTLGMMLMASSNHLLMIWIAIWVKGPEGQFPLTPAGWPFAAAPSPEPKDEF